jgi:hypothetical protein
MNTFRVLASPRVWGPVLGVVTVLALIFYAYLAAVASPQENLKDLPIALVNEDRGADLAGEKVNLGDRIIEKVTDPDAPAAGLEDAVWMIGAYLAGAVALGFVISLVRDLATRRGRREIRNPPEGAEAAG